MKMNRTDPKFKITKARADLVSEQPFFGVLALRLVITAWDNDYLMGTDGKTLFYNPAKVSKLPQHQVMGVVAHEILHCAFQHMFRRKQRDFGRWNEATDYVINAILLEERFSLPEGRLYDPKYKDMSAEEVYSKLPTTDGANAKGAWNIGASLDPNSSAAASKENEQAWLIAVQQAAHLAQQAGKMPGTLSSLIAATLTPQIPWQEKLWRFLNKRKPERITWNRPNRRLIANGLYMPSKKFVPTGEIVVAIDTSCSIVQRGLEIFGSELIEIHRTIQPSKLTVLNIDTEIHTIDEYAPYDQIKLTYYGRGGTSFAPAFAWIEEQMVKPDALVYLTDGYATWPENPMNIPTIWCLTNHDIIPPWGEHLVLDL